MVESKFACFYFEGAGAPLDRIAERSFQFSSQVYVVPPHAVVVEFGKSHLLFQEQAFVARATSMLSEFGSDFRVALASNHLFAFVMAKHACEDFLSVPLIALRDLIDPQGLNEKQLAETSKLISSLGKLQLRTLRDFLELPVSHFPSRFGEAGLLLKARVEGRFLPSFELSKLKPKFFAREELPSSYNGALTELIAVVERLLTEQIFPPLRQLSAKLEEVKISFLLESNSLYPTERRDFEVKFVEPQFRAVDTIRIIWTCIETRLQKEPIHFSTPILFIEVEATKWVIDLDEQVNMFDKARAREEKENILLTRQKLRYGDENIFRVELTQDRRPEKSWRKVLDPKAKIEKLEIAGRVPVRPVYRLPSPHLVHVSSDRSMIRSGEKRAERITEWEPMSEILASHWFENEKGIVFNTCQRIYSRVHLANGRELSIFEDVEGRFFLDGFSG